MPEELLIVAKASYSKQMKRADCLPSSVHWISKDCELTDARDSWQLILDLLHMQHDFIQFSSVSDCDEPKL